MKKQLLLVNLLFASAVASAFQVEGIRIEGLHKVSRGAVLDDLPFRVGDEFHENQSETVIQSLYRTGFFKEVSLARDNNILIIRVEERPTLGELTISGVREKDKIRKMLKDEGIAEGLFYDPALLLKAQQLLEKYYYSRGRYGVKVNTSVSMKGPIAHVSISIKEGDVARIKAIQIIGAKAFSQKELLKQFNLATTNWLSWFKSDDQYSKDKLNADLEILRSYYLNRGYVRFEIDSTQVELSPDKKTIRITIQIKEGSVYTFGEAKLSGQFVVPRKQLEKALSPIQSGSTFSRQILLDVKQALQDVMGDEGYGLADARVGDTIHDNTHKVDITFDLIPGKRMYVRRISFMGNATTKDEVLRRELPQMEGTWISTSLVKEGREKILRRGYGTDVEVETKPVSNDQVDLIYKIEEAKLGQLSAGLGYSASERLMFNFSISQENFFGTGNAVDFTFDKSKASTNYAVGYQDPYFTIDGVGLGASAYYNKSDLGRTTNLSNYTTDTLGGELRLVLPIGRFEALRFSFGYDDTHLKLDSGVATAAEITSFVNQYGKKFSEWVVGAGWSYDNLDQRIFPTQGVTQSIGVRGVVPGAKQQYYRVSYDLSSYYPLDKAHNWIINFNANLGFEDGYGKTRQVPFYRHFTAGGSRFVRGFVENSLGPKDSLGRAFGGNALTAATLALIFPIKPDLKSVRTSLFLDAGQVYDTRYRRKLVNGTLVDRNGGGIRYSVGVSLTWHTPLAGAPISFSLAKPLNAKSGDDRRYFAFSMGTQF